MLKRAATFVEPRLGRRKKTMEARIEELRNRAPTDINHGQALMLQGMANASLRAQTLSSNKIQLD
ncbi:MULTISPECIES: hypothetical protein [unclassified Ruegeria]|uniref:hypothetical protein n=1 Tax=unclassified Ruegeria TaxID=2625375 RepID=UPI001489BC0F|nr:MULTISPECIES: hypothetical protein [unclassified Ruegeria]